MASQGLQEDHATSALWLHHLSYKPAVTINARPNFPEKQMGRTPRISIKAGPRAGQALKQGYSIANTAGVDVHYATGWIDSADAGHPRQIHRQ